jgi:parallel beta-helix repeat protein
MKFTNKNQKKLAILFICLLSITYIYVILNSLITTDGTLDHGENKCEIKTSDFIELDYFHISGLGFGDYTWDEVSGFPWCTGNGTIDEPYIIDNIAVNGQNTSNCLYISHSDIYFIIQNSLFFNSSRNTSGIYAGIYFFNVTNGIIRNNTIYSNMHGIYTWNSQNCQFIENKAEENSKDGFYIYGSNKNNFSNNLLQENGERGYYVHTSHNNTIINDRIIENSLSSSVPGIEFQSSDSNKLFNSNISENSAGINAYTSENTHFENNTIRNNDNVGLSLGSLSHNCSIVNNTIVGNGNDGISVSSSDNINIHENNISQNQDYGLYLLQNSLINIVFNEIRENNNDGIYLAGNNNNTISFNKIFENQGYGIQLFSYLSYETNNNIIHNNTIVKNSQGGIRIYSSNLPIIYSNITSNYLFNNTGTNLYLYNADNNTIADNSFILCHDNEYTSAVYLSSADENKIFRNNFMDNGIGVNLRGSNQNLLYNNKISNSERYGVEFQLDSYLNIIETNQFMENWDGIYFSNGDNNTITENIISKSGNIGIDLIGSSSGDYNLFSRNFFIDNNVQARDNAGMNFWNSSEIGNYWDDYSGIDDSPIDGIGDTPYSNILGIIDYLPIWDDDEPIIFVNLPLNNSRQPYIAPEYNLNIDEIYLDTIWYTLDDGLTNITCNSSNTIQQGEWYAIWNTLKDGEQFQLTFYANDSFGHLGMNTTYLIKDAPPTINIISPLNDSRVGIEAPEYMVEISNDSITQWYTLDLGVNNITFSTNDTFEQSAWEAIWVTKSEGETISVRFYANDTFGQISMNEISLIKDAFPILNITSPLNESKIERTLFEFTIEIEDFQLNNMWYTIDGGIIQYPFLINETINSAFLTTWDAKADGEMIMIQFFANDSLGQVSSDILYLIKNTPETTGGGEIHGYNILVMFLGIISMIGLIYFHQNKKL